MKRIARRGLCLLFCIALCAAIAPAAGAYYNPNHEVISEASDPCLDEIVELVGSQSFSSVHVEAWVKGQVDYLLTGSKYAAVGGERFPYLNANGYADYVDDGVNKVAVYASGCYAYSKYASALCYGDFGTELYPTDSYGSIITSIWSISAEALEAFMRRECQAGEHIRFNSGIHSITFLAADEMGFYYSDYSGDSRAAIRLCYISFENFHTALRYAGTGIHIFNANTVKNGASRVVLRIGEPNISVDGVSIPIDSHGTAPCIIGDRTMLPIRSVIEALGGSVGWDNASKTVSLSLDGFSVSMSIGSATAWSGGSSYQLAAAPVIVGGRTMVPIRSLEYFGAEVQWNAADKSVTITYEQ